MSMNATNDLLDALTTRILTDRTSPGLGSTIRKAGSEYTEHYAYGYFRLPEFISKYPDSRLAVLRTGAAIAETKCRQEPKISFGAALRTLAQRRGEINAKGDFSGAVSDRLLVLMDQPIELAVETVRSLLIMASNAGGISLDHYGLMRTMYRWEHTNPEVSLAVRRRILLDFHSPVQTNDDES